MLSWGFHAFTKQLTVERWQETSRKRWGMTCNKGPRSHMNPGSCSSCLAVFSVVKLNELYLTSSLLLANSGQLFCSTGEPSQALTFLWGSCLVLSHLIALLATTQHRCSLSLSLTPTSDTHTPEKFHTKAPPQSY